MATEKSDEAEGGGLSRDDAAATQTEASEDAGDGPVRRVEIGDEPVTVIRASSAAEPVEEEHVEEERGWSFAAKALTFLLLLLAGAALGVWGAPKLAPMLPSGLAPVAAWLTPGRVEAEAEVAALGARLDEEAAALRARIEGEAALRSQFEQELAALRAQAEAEPDAGAIEAQVQEAVSGVESALSGRIDELRAAVDQIDISATSERVGEIESRVEGVTAELGSLREQLQNVEAAPSEEVAARIDTNRAELDGLRAEVGELSGAVSSLRQQLEEARASAQAQVAQAQEQARAAEAQADAAQAEAQERARATEEAAAAGRVAASAQADVAQIRAALESGEPFEEPLWRITDSTGVYAPMSLASAAPSGVQTPAELRASFSDAAHEAIRGSIVAEAGGGVLARSRAFLEAQVASRSLTPQEGASTDAVLSRMEEALRRDDLQAALAEAEQLPPEASAAMNEWLAAARLRAEADAGLAELSASVSALN